MPRPPVTAGGSGRLMGKSAEVQRRRTSKTQLSNKRNFLLVCIMTDSILLLHTPIPVIQGRLRPAGECKLVCLFVWTFACTGLKNRKCEIELRFWKIDFEYSVLKRVSIFRASFNIPTSDRKKSPTFLDEIAGNMSNICTFINPNSPRVSRVKNELQYK